MAKQLMDHLESVTERDEGYFVDLFVRESNVNAINMYKRVSDHSFHAYCIIYACPYETEALQQAAVFWSKGQLPLQ